MELDFLWRKTQTELFRLRVDMANNPLSAKASLAIDIKAQGSQQLVVLFVVGAILFCGVAMLFIYLKEGLWPVPICIGAAMGAVALWCHTKSQPSLDRATAGVTKITSDARGTRIETNAITMGDESSGAMLERIISNLNYRQNIPTADGNVKSDLSIDTSLEGRTEANLRVGVANNESAELQQRALIYFAGNPTLEVVAQPEVDSPFGLLNTKPGG